MLGAHKKALLLNVKGLVFAWLTTLFHR